MLAIFHIRDEENALYVLKSLNSLQKKTFLSARDSYGNIGWSTPFMSQPKSFKQFR